MPVVTPRAASTETVKSVLMRFAVLRHHPLQTELLGALVRDRHANQTPAVRGHEIDRLRRDFFRRHDQIAFVLAIGIVGHDHHAPFGDIAHHIVNRIELKCLRRLGIIEPITNYVRGSVERLNLLLVLLLVIVVLGIFDTCGA